MRCRRLNQVNYPPHLVYREIYNQVPNPMTPLRTRHIMNHRVTRRVDANGIGRHRKNQLGIMMGRIPYQARVVALLARLRIRARRRKRKRLMTVMQSYSSMNCPGWAKNGPINTIRQPQMEMKTWMKLSRTELILIYKFIHYGARYTKVKRKCPVSQRT